MIDDLLDNVRWEGDEHVCNECENVYERRQPLVLVVADVEVQYYCSWECVAALALNVSKEVDEDEGTERTDYVLMKAKSFVEWANG